MDGAHIALFIELYHSELYYWVSANGVLVYIARMTKFWAPNHTHSLPHEQYY